MNGQDAPEDRLLEQMLRERIGRERPPDLLARILEPRPAAARAQPAPARWFAAGIGLGAVAAAALLLLAPWPVGGRAERRVGFAVEHGRLEWRRDADQRRIDAGQRAELPLERGDRLAGATTRVRIGALGLLSMHGPTEIEVLQMEWKPFGAGALLGAITVGVVSGAIHWSSGAREVGAQTGESLVLRGDDAGAAAARSAERIAALETELAGVRQENERLAAVVARTAAQTPPDAVTGVAGEPAAPPAEAPLGPAFSWHGHDDLLAQIDWRVTGKAMKEMSALAVRLLEEMERTGQPPLDVLADMQRLNADLIRQAQLVAEADVPGTGINAKFIHPALAANQIDAALKSANLALDAGQSDALRAIAARLTSEDDQRRADERSGMTALEKLCGELDLRDRFYRETERLLTREQAGVLWNQATRGRLTLDLFDSGIAWVQHLDPSRAADADAFARDLGDKMRAKVGLDDQQLAELRPVLEAHARSLPAELWSEGSGATGIKSGVVRELARRQVELIRSLLQRGDLTPEQRRKLLALTSVIAPVRRG